jgi:hypothetical protein
MAEALSSPEQVLISYIFSCSYSRWRKCCSMDERTRAILREYEEACLEIRRIYQVRGSSLPHAIFT